MLPLTDNKSLRMRPLGMLNNKNLRALVVVGSAMFAFGCATPAIEIKPFDKSATVEASYDEVWNKLIRFTSTNDVSVSSVEKDSGLIVLSGDNLSQGVISQYCAAQAPFLSVLSSGTAKGSIVVTDDDGFVTVTVNAKFNTTFVNNMSSPPTYNTVPCNSTGAFETAVLGAIQ